MFTVMLIGSLASALICALIIATRDHHIRHTGDASGGSVQKLHDNVVPRIGGVGIFTGIVVSCIALLASNKPLAVELLIIFACLLPVYITGLAEDITKAISPTNRYLAAALSALLITSITDIRILEVDVWGMDALVAIPAVATLFFIFCVAGLSHAFNLIDGQNGQCSGITCITCVAVMWESAELGMQGPFALAAVCAAANLGFLLFNYPLGKIFLGDAGAYLNGAILAVATVQLVQQSGSLSPWYAVLLLIYPIWETLFSMWRRIAVGRSFSEPDAEHLHSLYYKALKSPNNVWRNSSAPALWLLSAVFCVVASFVAHSTALCLAFVAVFGLIYSQLYRHAQTLSR
jgi:UDP-N-acetylmuramyl pentapeptide phosphotransferase/UDP-N-acetylglucosamine-1-phosphate transferase